MRCAAVNKNRSKAQQLAINTGMSLLIPVGLFVIFGILSRGRSFTWAMFMATLKQSVTPIIICYGLMLNMSVGMMNFSAGGMILFAGIVGGNLAKNLGLGIPGMILLCILLCTLEGAATGVLYNVMRVPCIVLSLGMMLIWESFPKVLYQDGVNLKANMTTLAKQPYCYMIMLIAFLIFHILFNYTAFGHNLRALGNNQAISISVGLNRDKSKFLSFALGGFFLGIAAFMYISERGAVRNVASMGSMTIMMDGFMGMFIAMFLSRYCNMSVAIILGTFSMKFLSNGFVSLGMSSTVRDIVQGLFLLILLTISANSGYFDRKKADREFAEACNAAYAKKTA